jgi:hypothetical protein
MISYLPWLLRPETVWIFIPLTAIVLGIGKGIVETITQSFERIQVAKLQSAGPVAGVSEDSLSQIREEMARLRDTTTQHAISLQHAVERLEQRVEFMERKSSTAATGQPGDIDTTVPVATEPRIQVAGRL